MYYVLPMEIKTFSEDNMALQTQLIMTIPEPIADLHNFPSGYRHILTMILTELLHTSH